MANQSKNTRKNKSRNASKTKKNFLYRFLDGFVNALKLSGNSDLFLGVFIILEGLCLIFAPSLFPVFIIIGTVIGFTWLIELVVDIITGRQKLNIQKTKIMAFGPITS